MSQVMSQSAVFRLRLGLGLPVFLSQVKHFDSLTHLNFNIMRLMHQWIETPTPHPQVRVGIMGEWTLYWTKLLPKGVELLTTIEPPPGHVGANVGNLTYNEDTGKY